MKRWVAVFLVAGLAGAVGYYFGYAQGSDRTSPEEQAALEDAFRESMRGVVLEGSFTVEGSSREPSVERYTIERVEKMAGALWVFHARVEFGDTDLALPVPVRIEWAGDTPVVSLTDAALPGLGTFTVRLVLYRDRYAGMWSNPETGGFQFGILRRGDEAPER